MTEQLRPIEAADAPPGDEVLYQTDEGRYQPATVLSVEHHGARKILVEGRTVAVVAYRGRAIGEWLTYADLTPAPPAPAVDHVARVAATLGLRAPVRLSDLESPLAAASPRRPETLEELRARRRNWRSPQASDEPIAAAATAIAEAEAYAQDAVAAYRALLRAELAALTDQLQLGAAGMSQHGRELVRWRIHGIQDALAIIDRRAQ